MRILVGNNTLHSLGGSETYAYAFIYELKRLGHDVTCITTGRHGIVSGKIAALGVPVHFDKIEGSFDVAFLSHPTSIAAAQKVKAFKVQTCHGIQHHLEQPVKNMDAYVGISNEVCLHLLNKGHKPTLITNGIDCNRFTPTKPLNDKLTSVLSLALNVELNNTLRKICSFMGVNFTSLHKLRNGVWNIENYINNADLVVSIGRGAYESMACGRNVVLIDNRHYVKEGIIGDGFVTDNNVSSFLKNNCSGRYLKKKYSIDQIRMEIQKYNVEEGKNLRNFALSRLNIETQVKKYLELVP